MRAPEFIIYAPGFDDTVGGIVALHLLCHRLNKLRYKAALWPWDRSSRLKLVDWISIRSHPADYLKLRLGYPKGPFGGCPLVFDPRHLRDAVVIYPEITSRNPLGASKVARWFLHKPGYHRGRIAYGDGEIYFFYNEAFNDTAINPDADNFLKLTYFNPLYRQTNFGARSGACYLVRKGRKRKLDKHPPDAVPIDGLSHREKAALFNKMECLYSYDSHSFYVTLAAICGCTPVVIPEEGVSKEEWQPSPRLRKGVAYGEAEIPLAKQQRGDLLARLARQVEEEDQLLHRFVEKCRAHFDR
jgi:hypothetical protein